MKKLSLVLLCTLVWCGCKKSTSNPQPQTSVIGKWTQTKAVYSEYVNGVGTPTTDILNDPNIYIQFNSNGTGVSSQGSSGTYTTQSFTYSISGNLLTATANNNTETDTIKTLTTNSLVIRSGTHTNYGGKQYDDIYDDYYGK